MLVQELQKDPNFPRVSEALVRKRKRERERGRKQRNKEKEMEGGKKERSEGGKKGQKRGERNEIIKHFIVKCL